jgi:cardiolipin synthase A/B
MPPDLRERLLSGGVRLLIFRPEVRWFQFRRRRLRRMHRKITVVDGRVGFVGGINIIDDMNTPGHMPPRYDFAVRVEGPLVADMQEQAETLWSRVAWVNLRRNWRATHHFASEARPAGTQQAALLVRDNLRHRSDIEDAYLQAIREAHREIVLANAYFFPGKRFRHALVDAAQRGVRVVLLLQGRVEYMLLHYASRALYGMLLDAGVEIHEYHRSFLHAKVAVIDGRWSTVGSSNIDPFSLMLAREANVVALDREFAGELRSALQNALEREARVVPKKRWNRQPMARRVVIWVAYAAVRFLMGVFGYAGKH